ncbi:hypothetical protein H0H92_011779 [Tricholoma furcatifolium]|nr:hypothetical protein H0H92_011779 [Tricholoma furcatifolium]
MCQWFAPTKLNVTFETEGKGRFSAEEIESMVVRDDAGDVVSLNLPTKFVLISNHQVCRDARKPVLALINYQDLRRLVVRMVSYILHWSSRSTPLRIHYTKEKFTVDTNRWLGTFSHTHHCKIQLNGTIKGMQLYGFIFLARSWASDRLQLASHLSALGKRAEEEDKPLCFLLYPEGTLVSPNTRPISKKFAEKEGIADLSNVLLPRSTGLYYSLRSLAPRVPDLKLIDLTVVYPGIPPMGYGQDYYTLRSIFMNGVPPPVIHIHLKMFDVAADVPIGDVMSASPSETLHSETDGSENKKAFDLWLRLLWQEKDDLITNFFQTKAFRPKGMTPVEIPVKLRKRRELLDAFCFFLPAGAGYLWGMVRR